MKFPKQYCCTKIDTRDGWMSLKYKTRIDIHAQYSDWQTQDDFFPERPTKYNGCPENKKVKLKPSVKIVFNKPMLPADQKLIDVNINSCEPDLNPKWTQSGWRVDIIPKSVYTVPQARALADKLKQCIANNSKIVFV